MDKRGQPCVEARFNFLKGQKETLKKEWLKTREFFLENDRARNHWLKEILKEKYGSNSRELEIAFEFHQDELARWAEIDPEKIDHCCAMKPPQIDKY
jgi:hypothetical protein